MFSIDQLVRKNIASLIPYSSAREEYAGDDGIFLDANENPYNSSVNRYPDPLQVTVKNRISRLKNINPERIFLGNGSDEPIDLLIRAFCEPGGIDNILSIKPTYGMYKVCADINNVEFREVLLREGYQIDLKGIEQKTDAQSKLLFLCSPNNPTSNSMHKDDIIYLLETFHGLVVLDEAYIDFSVQPSLLHEVENYPNLVVLQTFSKAWGMAGIRLGIAFASREIVRVLNKIKYPYNINILTQKFILERLEKENEKKLWVEKILEEREKLRLKLKALDIVDNILPSDANFLMVKFDESRKVFNYLTGKKIIIRDRSHVQLCEGYLRITIGTEDENELLVEALREFVSGQKVLQ